MNDDRNAHLTPPPQKRIKSADLYRAQHGISPERINDGALKDIQLLAAAQRHFHHESRSRDRSRTQDTSRDSSTQDHGDRNDSLLGQALESGNSATVR